MTRKRQRRCEEAKEREGRERERERERERWGREREKERVGKGKGRKFPHPLTTSRLGCQLLSLSKDRSLHVWPIGEQLKQDLHFDAGTTEPSHNDSTDAPSPHSTSSSESKVRPKQIIAEAETSFSIEPFPTSLVSDGGLDVSFPTTPINKSFNILSSSNEATPTSSIFGMSATRTLSQEFNQVNLEIPNLEMERVSTCTCTCKA